MWEIVIWRRGILWSVGTIVGRLTYFGGDDEA
jgi:hypothetical protein